MAIASSDRQAELAFPGPRAVAGLSPWRTTTNALLFCAMIVALGFLDARGALGGLWMAGPLALAAMLVALASPATLPWEWRQARGLGIVGLVLGARAVASLAGPAPGLGVREAMVLCVVLTVAAALWTAGRADGTRVVATWCLAQLLGCIVEIVLTFWSSPALGQGLAARIGQAGSPTGCLVEGLGGMLGAMMLALGPKGGRGLGMNEIPSRVPIPWRRRVVALGLGVGVGLWLAKMPWSLAADQARALWAGRRALQALWLQSLLAGWGRQAVEPLGQALALPDRAIFQAWSGPWGLLAMGGLLGVGVMLMACMELIVLSPARRVRANGVPAGSAAIALFVGGLILGGGPMSGAALFVFAGWSALALASAWRPARRPMMDAEVGPDVEPRRPSRWTLTNCGATGVAWLGLAAPVALLAMPVLGNRALASSQNPRASLETRIAAVRRAQALNPFNPAIPARLASLLRDQMTQEAEWSESLYWSVIDAYAAAQRLSPYDATYPMAEAQFQVICKRSEDAMRCIDRALERQPRAAELLNWKFLTAMRLNQEQDAWRALNQGLKSEPMSADWWTRQYLLAGARGQRALAGRSLSGALTANLATPRLIAEAWAQGRGDGALTMPGVQLPAPPDKPADAGSSQ